MRYLVLLAFLVLGFLLYQRQFSNKPVSAPELESTVTRPVQQVNTLVDGSQQNVAFSWLNQDISQGNPISWSAHPNPSGPFRPAQNSMCAQIQHARNQIYRDVYPSQAEIVIQGTPPLEREMYASRQESHSIFPFAKMRASPLCCPSTYTTSTGCVCGT